MNDIEVIEESVTIDDIIQSTNQPSDQKAGNRVVQIAGPLSNQIALNFAEQTLQLVVLPELM